MTPVATARIEDKAMRSRGGLAEETAGELARVRAAFPGWNVWRSDEGCWWATRNRPLAPSRWPDGYDLTVTGANLFELRAEIARQPG